MRVCRSANYRVMPWKNGGGSTTEVAISPPDAPLDRFDWRLSMARVEVDGPFSEFPGIDRTLTLLDGPLIALEVDGRSVILGPDRPTLGFAGEDRVWASVPEGPVTDFNVMTRRGRCRHTLRRLEVAGRRAAEPGAGTTILFLAHGPILACREDGGAEAMLGPRDALILEAEDPRGWRLEAPTPAVALQIDITPAA